MTVRLVRMRSNHIFMMEHLMLELIAQLFSRKLILPLEPSHDQLDGGKRFRSAAE